MDHNEHNYKRKTRKVSEGRIDRIIGIVGIAFGVKDLLKDLGILPDKDSENFEKILTAIGENYAAIQQVGDKVDRNFAAMQLVYRVASQTLAIIEDTRIEMRQEFKKVLDSLQDLKVADKVSNLATFMDDFRKEVGVVNQLSPEARVTELTRPGGILDKLNSAVYSDGILHGNLNHIINEKLAIPKDENDNVAFAVLHITYYGVQSYVSVMFFILDQISFLADYYYKKGDIEKCNGYFDVLQINFNFFKSKLLPFDNKDQLIDKVIDILNLIEGLLFVRNEREDIFKLLQERVDSLNVVKRKLEEMVLPIDPDQPDQIKKNPDFSGSRVETPLEMWINGAKVSYAIQCKRNDTYSKIGEWSRPIFVSGKACPMLKIPVDPQRRSRLIYRRFNDGEPELAGVIEDVYRTNFLDIDRDVYNAALNTDEETGKKEILTLFDNGADLWKSFENGRKAIHSAAQSGNIRIADLLLKNNTGIIDAQDDDGRTPIYIASEAGYDNFIQFLLEKNADINVKTKSEKLTPLHIAAYNGYASTVRTISKDENTDVNAKDKTGFTPVHSAVYGGIHVLEVLISHNRTDINAKSADGLTALHLAAIDDYDDIVRELIKSGRSDVNAVSKGNMTALHYASSLGNFNTVQDLISAKETDVNIPSANNFTAIHLAISQKRFKIVDVLLNQTRIDVNKKSKGDITPLHIAALLDEKDVTLKLLQNKITIEAKTSLDLTALHIAVVHNNHDVVSVLLDNGAGIETRCNGSSPLHLAAFYGSKESARVLLNKGAKLKVYDNSGLCPAHTAAERGHLEVLRELINFNDKLVNLKSLDVSKRSTCLHFAAEQGYLDVMKYLIDEKNADFDSATKFGDTPLHYASKYGHLDVVKYLTDRKGASVESKNGFGETPLHLASYSGNLDIVEYLVDIKKADINATTADIDKPLHYAALSGNINLMKYFINDKSMKAYNPNIDLYNPLDYAVWYNREQVFNYLLEKDLPTYKTLNAATLSGNLSSVKLVLNYNPPTMNYPIGVAARFGYKDIVKYYVEEKNANLRPYATSLSPLHFAALSGNIELVKYITEENNIPIDPVFSILGITPLCLAALSGNLETVKYFVGKGARINPFYDITAAPSKFAVASGNLQVVKYFVEELQVNLTRGYSLSSAKVLTQTDYGTINSLRKYIDFGLEYTAPKNYYPHLSGFLDTAIVRGHLNIIKYFLEEKKIPYDISNGLFTAVSNNQYDITRYLVEERTISVDITDSEGNTPLFEAVGYRYYFKDIYMDIIKYLIEDCKANLTHRNNYGETFLHTVCRFNMVNVVKYLIQDKKVDINIRDNTLNTPLIKSVHYSSYELSNFLILNGANVNAKNSGGVTALHEAASIGFYNPNQQLLEEIISLVDHGADVNALDDENKTPLDYLGPVADSKIKDYLISKGAHYGPRKHRSLDTRIGENLYNKQFSLLTNVTEKLTEFSKCLKLAFTTAPSLSHVQTFDVNGTLFLLDVFIRKITGQKYVSTVDGGVNAEKAKVYALNIVTEFENALKRTCKINGISFKELNVDSFELYLNVNNKLIYGNFSEIPAILYSSIENSVSVDEKFKNTLKCLIEEILRHAYISQNFVINNNVTNDIGFINNTIRLANNKPSIRLPNNTIRKINNSNSI